MKTIQCSFILICLTITLISCVKHPKVEHQVEPLIISNVQNQSSSHFLTKGPDGAIYISWIEIDSLQQKHFYFSKFNSKIQSFENKQTIPIAQNASIHEEGMPKIAIKGDGSLFAIYNISTPYKNRKWGLSNLQYLQSFDGGKTWTLPKPVAPKDVSQGLSVGFANLTRLTNGEIGITFLGSTQGAPHLKKGENMGEMHHMEMSGRPIKFVKTNGKKGLGHIITIDTSACQCCRTSLAAGNLDDVYVVYRDLQPKNYRDISVVRSIDNGQSFTKPFDFSRDHWKINGCPHNGPAVIAAGKNNYVTWFTAGTQHSGVNFAVLDSIGHVMSAYTLSRNGQFIQVGKDNAGRPLIAYSEQYRQDGKIYSRIVVCQLIDQSFFKKVITPDGIQANYPMVMESGFGNAIVAWQNNGHIAYRSIDLQTINMPMSEVIAY